MVRRRAGPRPPADIVAELDIQDRIEEAELSLERERRSLAQAESKREILEKYTCDKTIKELESEVKKAHSDELAKQATWELEKSKEDKLEKQIAICTLDRPDRRLVVYANDPLAGRQQPVADRGRRDGPRAAEDRQHPRLQRPDAGQRQGPRVADRHVAPRMKARVKVDAFADQTMRRRGQRGRPPARPGQHLQLRYQGLHDPDPDRRRRPASGRA